jgi:hypothetical protein
VLLYVYLGCSATVLNKKLSNSMIIIDCSDYGPVAPWIGTADQLAGFLQYAEHMIASHSTDFLDTWHDRWSQALAWDSVMYDDTDDEWYARCLLLQAVQGLRGIKVPEVQVISD